MIARLRLVLPPDSILITLAFLYAVSEGPVLWCEWKLGGPLHLAIRPGAMLFILAAAALGAFRILGFHPFYRPSYRRWLESTPWVRGKPLPLGPIHLAWQDLILFTAAGWLALFQPGLDARRLLPAFLLPYLGLLGATFWTTGAWPFGYLVVFGMGLVVRAWPYPLPCLGIALATYVIALGGLWRSLGAYPWSLDWQDDFRRRLNGQPLEDFRHYGGWVGWPFNRLAPGAVAEPDPRRRDAVLASLLAGWWFYAVMAVVPPEVRQQFAIMIYSYGMLIPIVKRLGTYCAGHDAPLSLAGRIVTLRWIIRGYDQVFVAPLGALLVSGFLPFLLAPLGVLLHVALAVSMGAAFLVLWNVGPRLRDWRLTGRHRIGPGLTKNPNQFLEVG